MGHLHKFKGSQLIIEIGKSGYSTWLYTAAVHVPYKAIYTSTKVPSQNLPRCQRRASSPTWTDKSYIIWFNCHPTHPI